MKTIMNNAIRVAKGMIFLHSKKIIHGDLHPKNILLNDRNEAVIADFGNSGRLESGTTDINTAYWRYAPPEYLRPDPGRNGITWLTTDKSFDIFQYSLLLWAMITYSEPFSENEPSYRLQHQDHRPQLDGMNIPLAIELLLKQCWHTNPDHRLPFDFILCHLEMYTASQSL